MSLIERIDQEFKEAMKSKDELRLSVLRLLRTSLKNRQIELQKPLVDQDAITVIKTTVKQYQDALSDFLNAGRTDLADRQQKEISVLNEYLPPSLPSDQLEALVKSALQSSGVTDVGKAMGVAMKAVDGRADGNEVRKIVQKLLG
jgi:uncharacterized protein YqeY